MEKNFVFRPPIFSDIQRVVFTIDGGQIFTWDLTGQSLRTSVGSKRGSGLEG